MREKLLEGGNSQDYLQGIGGGHAPGGRMGMLGGLMNMMGMGGDPTSRALDKAMDVSKQYMDPFIERGTRAGDVAEGEYGQMVNDPAAMLERFSQGYQPSKYYQMMQDRMGQAASNTAAAGGMRGSPLEQRQQQELTQSLLSKDMQQYLQNVMGLYGKGVSGEEGLYRTGFEGARGLSSDLANMFGTQAQLAEARRREAEEARRYEDSQSGGFLDDLMSVGGTIAGGIFGGPAGAAAGGAAGKAMGGFF